MKEAIVATHPEYRVVDVGDTFILADRIVQEELARNILPKLKDGHLQGTISQFMHRWSTAWAAYATVPLIGFAFHARNHLSNWFNIIVGGVRNPQVLVKAIEAQAANRKIHQHMMANVIMDYDQAIGAMVASGDIAEDMAHLLLQARDHGILGSSFFTDLNTDRAIFDPKSGEMGLSLLNNPVIDWGTKFGSFIENNARLAMFQDGLNQGLNAHMSSRRVKTFLFDYSDLTKQEQDIKALSRFYTCLLYTSPSPRDS